MTVRLRLSLTGPVPGGDCLDVFRPVAAPLEFWGDDDWQGGHPVLLGESLECVRVFVDVDLKERHTSLIQEFLGPHARRTGLASVERDEQAGHGWDSTPNVVVVRHSDSSGEPVCMGQEYDRSEAVDAGDITAGEQIEGRG